MHPGRTAHAGRRGTAMKKRIVTLANFGWGIAHEAVTRLLPIRLDTMVPRTHMYTYAANVWDSSIVTIRNFCIAVGRTSPASWSSSTASNAARWSDMCCFMNASSSSLSCAAPPPHPLSPAVQRCKSCESSRYGFRVGDRSRGSYATPADFLRHDGTPYRGLRARRWGLGFVHRSRAILCRAVPNLSIMIRNLCIALRRARRCTTCVTRRTQLAECPRSGNPSSSGIISKAVRMDG
jgi:hypothetical protein